MNTTFDNELIELLADEYQMMAAQLYNDLADSMIGCDTPEGPSVEDLNDGMTDCMADRIYDEEVIRRGGEHCPEFREAAKLIAKRIV